MPSTPDTAARLPRPLPLLGHGMHLLRNPLDFLARARAQGDIVRIKLGPSSAYIVNSPDLIRQVLVGSAKKFEKGVQFDKLRPVLGNGLVTAGGEEHLRNRRLIQPAFHHTRIATYGTVMRDLTAAKVASWQDGVPLRLDNELAQLTMAIVGKTLFSTQLGAEAVDEVLRSMPAILRGITRRALAPTQLLEKIPTPENRRFDRSNRSLREVVDRIIGEYRLTGTDHGDMVSMLLLARDESSGEGLSDTQVRDEVLTMLLAGTETTANLLSWVCHVLGQRPDLEARLHAEVDEVIGDRELRFEDFGRLTFTRWLITETLRMYPPAWLLTRRAVEPVTLGGVALKAGTSILLSPYALHRDPTIYADAEVFDPDRWRPERAGDIPRPAFVPFGAGNRQCIGEGFAWAESAIILATIAKRWRLVPVPDVRVRMTASGTLAPNTLPMVPRARVRTKAGRRPSELALAAGPI